MVSVLDWRWPYQGFFIAYLFGHVDLPVHSLVQCHRDFLADEGSLNCSILSLMLNG